MEALVRRHHSGMAAAMATARNVTILVQESDQIEEGNITLPITRILYSTRMYYAIANETKANLPPFFIRVLPLRQAFSGNLQSGYRARSVRTIVL
jgi:hypothetical protein